MSTGRRHAQLVSGIVLAAFVSPALGQAEDYPSRPIRYITPYAPGGSTSFTARLVGQQLTDAWGQAVVVDNRPGANTIIGTRIALESEPDGYTLLSIGAALAGNQTLVKTPYDALKDVTCIATVLSYENVLVVPAMMPINSVKDLIDLAKKKPGEVPYGTSSHGGPTHLLAELFNQEAGIKTLHVPYKGGGPAVSDLMGGHITFFFSNPKNVADLIRDGRLRALAVTGAKRTPAFPDVPTFGEAGLPKMRLTNWQGVGGPAGIPAPIVKKISLEIQRLLGHPKTVKILNNLGFEPFYNGPDATSELLKADIDKYARIIKAAKIRVER